MRRAPAPAPKVKADPEEAVAAKPKANGTRATASDGTANGKAKPAVKPKSAPKSEIYLDKPAGTPDDLTRIAGIGPKLQETLNKQGIFHFWQIAGLKAADIARLDDALRFPGRIGRDKWVAQAKQLEK